MRSIPNGIKQFRLLRIFIRFVRGLRGHWLGVTRDLKDQIAFDELVSRTDGAVSDYLAIHAVTKLQIGAGTNPLPGWLNTDIEPVDDVICFLDATREFPIRDQCFDRVFSEHMIEHVPYKSGLYIFSEIFRILKPGGRVRIATPDMDRIVALASLEKSENQKRYIEWSVGEMGLHNPAPTTFQERRTEWNIENTHFRVYFPNIVDDSSCFVINHFFRSYGHLFLYDFKTLYGAMCAAGFESIERQTPGRSEDNHLVNVESHQMLIGEEMNDYETLILEGVRP